MYVQYLHSYTHISVQYVFTPHQGPWCVQRVQLKGEGLHSYWAEALVCILCGRTKWVQWEIRKTKIWRSLCSACESSSLCSMKEGIVPLCSFMKCENKELSVVLHHLQWAKKNQINANCKDPLQQAALTHFQAVEWKSVLSYKLIVRHGVVVFHNKAYQCQVWHVHIKLKVFIPLRVKTYNRYVILF